ncbi:hypothetical protein GCM10020358_46290 [Amorphoplanes nipponensis]|uniref:DUF11 domain-containing protein n=1 Tax=Actinoplanes nipponensis TaxID=135950 RepID=A0A919JPP7_9ACTN|nr:hypothetical protein [Actinoplanes nipponensis]GIE53498.1 hypothetical protein Ani05nite_70320 [Actinoplanes nipponensis]
MNLAHAGRRLGRLAVAATAVAVASAAAPAHAATDPEEPGPGAGARVWAFVEDMTVAPAGAPAKDLHIEVITSGAVNPRLVLDVSELAGLVTFAWPAGCTTAGPVATCPAPAGSVDNNAPLLIPVRAVAGAPAGAHGTLSVRGDADNPGDGNDLMSDDAVITVSGDGPDLAALVEGSIPDARVGDRVHAPMTVTNLGNRAVQGIRVTVEFSRPLTPTPYANCRYGFRAGFPERGTVAVCDFPQRIDPGAVFKLQRGFGALVTEAAVDHQVIEYTVAPQAGAGLPTGVTLEGRGGSRLSLVRVTAAPARARVSSAADVDSANDSRYWGFEVDNLLDVAAVGATASGAIGETVRVEVGARNIGGAIDFTRYGSSAARFRFQLPGGTEVTDVPANCALDGDSPATTYVCNLPSLYFDRGATFLRTFALTVTGPSYDAGQVYADIDGPAADEDFANDRADVSLTVTG